MPVPDALAAALADRYRIERELGQGGMATVYLAADLKHDRKVALKVLKPELAAVLGADRFVVEIKTTAALQHPHILPLFDSGSADGFLYYVMPFIDGETLRSKLDRETQFGIEEAVRIAAAVADALDYAHRHGVIHRDIKPENILMHDGRPMVADFGIALALSAAAGGRMTETGLSLGTPHYMSPEQATAEKEITARSDVYSLGSVLYEMLTGAPPHVGASAQQIIMKIVTEDAAPVTKLRKAVPANVAAAVAMSLEKLPADRFASAKAFGDALTNPGFMGNSTVMAAGAAGPAGRGTSRRTLAIAGASTLAVGMLLGFLLTRRAPSVPPVVRFTMTASPAERIVSNYNFDRPFALSPDGSRVAFVANDSGASVTMLYVRSLDQLSAIKIPGSEDAVNPFFSPDGRWVGFLTLGGRDLKKVAAGGGPVSTIAKDAWPLYGAPSWGDDGFIVYQATGRRLRRISGGGGPATVVLDSATGIQPMSPQVLPGGGAVLFSACAAGTAAADCRSVLSVIDVNSHKVTPLVEGAVRGWYFTGDLLLYTTADGALFGVPFDPAKRAIKGSPVALLDRLDLGRDRLARVAISASGALAYFPTHGDDQAQIVQVDRSGRARTIIAKPAPYMQPKLSPDGRRIALTFPDARNLLQIWIHDLPSGTTAQLTFEGESQRPSWSPDGRELVFSSTRGNAKTWIWRAPADGSEPGARAGEGPEIIGVGATSWTRDGKWIVFDGPAEDGTGAGSDDIYATPTSGTRKMRSAVATVAQEQVGEVSPDGRWIAYVSNDNGKNQVYVMPFLRPGGRTLISIGAAAEPVWASNNEIAYRSYEMDSLIVATLTFGPTITVTRKALFDARQYARGTPSWRNFDVSRDGQRFLFVRPTTRAALVEPVIVLNWAEEVRRMMSATGAR
jgi:serine/threonine protein kinase